MWGILFVTGVTTLTLHEALVIVISRTVGAYFVVVLFECQSWLSCFQCYHGYKPARSSGGRGFVGRAAAAERKKDWPGSSARSNFLVKSTCFSKLQTAALITKCTLFALACSYQRDLNSFLNILTKLLYILNEQITSFSIYPNWLSFHHTSTVQWNLRTRLLIHHI